VTGLENCIDVSKKFFIVKKNVILEVMFCDAGKTDRCSTFPCNEAAKSHKNDVL
jgi:hypothetical protein